VAQLGEANAEAYRDPAYHADMKEYVAVHSTAAAAAGKGKGKGAKKKGVTLHLEMFQELQVGALICVLRYTTVTAVWIILTHQDPAEVLCMSWHAHLGLLGLRV
jgi:hypothetical protein